MRSSVFSSAIAGLAMCTGALALTAPQVVLNIQDLTTKSQNLQDPAKSITILSPALYPAGLGPFPEIVDGFRDIIASVTEDEAAMANDPQYTGSDSDSIFAAFKDFVAVHQELLSILIGKAGVFNVVPIIGVPIAETLRDLEKVVDTVAITLANQVQGHADDIQSQTSLLDGTLRTAIGAYEGVFGSP